MGVFSYIFNIIDKILCIESCLNCKKQANLLCKDCIKDIPHPEHDLPGYIFALYEYRTPIIKKILTDAKYRKKFSGLQVFGPYLASVMIDIISEYTELNNYTNILIIPVPISRKRLKTRGYNQAKIIAESIISNLPTNIKGGSILNFKLADNVIEKIKDTTPQASIHKRSVRLNNPKGTFKIKNPEILQGSLCIVIDDITTTGGTILEMRRILIESGAQTVLGLTIAH